MTVAMLLSNTLKAAEAQMQSRYFQTNRNGETEKRGHGEEA
jgi:hypothetical protein